MVASTPNQQVRCWVAAACCGGLCLARNVHTVVLIMVFNRDGGPCFCGRYNGHNENSTRRQEQTTATKKTTMAIAIVITITTIT